MSEMASRVSIDAEQYMRMQHELRAYRDAQQFAPIIPEFHLRKGVITARDPTTYTCSVLIGAADESDTPGVAIPGIRLADTVYPMVGATCFVAFNGPEPTVLFTVGVGVGAARVWKNANGSTTSGVIAAVGFGTVIYDTDGLYNAGASDRLTIPWPGRWRVHGANQWDPGTVAGWRETGVWRLNGGGAVDALVRVKEHQSHTAVEQGQTVEDEAVLAAADWLELRVVQNSGGAESILTSGPAEDDYPVLAASWEGPPP
jgi:hypothetical protein